MDRCTFFQHLVRSRLLPELVIEEAVGRFAEDAPAEVIAQALVGDGLLTPYQAQQLLAGKSRRLVLRRYHILDPLGRGGMGQVFKAVHTVMGRIVALKVISPKLVRNARARELFRREVLAATQLHHPNIAAAYDADEAQGVLFLVMEYVEGVNLDTLVKRQGPLPVGLACDLMRQTGEALQHAHEKGIVHRDLKPANLLIHYPQNSTAPVDEVRERADAGPSAVVKVLDFGLARLRGAVQSETIWVSAGAVIGTPDYISPEQAQDVHAVDIRSDLYSLGCTFFYALTGRVPFPGANPMEKLVKQVLREPEPVEALRPEIPAVVGSIVRRLMAKDPDQRFQTPAELIDALTALGDPECCQPAIATQSASPGAAGGESNWDPNRPPTAAAEPTQEFDDATLIINWQRWTAIIEAYLRRGHLYRVNAQEYRKLYQTLVEGCRSRASTSEGDQRTFWLWLEELVKPWLTPAALAQTDRELLYDLLHHCHEAGLKLGGRREGLGSGIRRWLSGRL